jgi:hypothetical protein
MVFRVIINGYQIQLGNILCNTNFVNLPLGNMCVHRLLLDVNFMVTCEGSKGLIRALDSKGGEPSEPTTILTGGDNSLSASNINEKCCLTV